VLIPKVTGPSPKVTGPSPKVTGSSPKVTGLSARGDAGFGHNVETERALAHRRTYLIAPTTRPRVI
jgi:hypothetical protein